MLDTLAAQPGVKSVGLTDNPDLANNNSTYNIIIPGEEVREDRHNAEWERVNAGYLATLQLPLLRGRFIQESDQANTPPVAVINETLAKEQFGSEDRCLGRIMQVGRAGLKFTVVGLVGDAKHRGVREETEPTFYTSIFQEKEP